MTLVLISEKERVEYKLLTCDRVPLTYWADLYALYVGLDKSVEASAGKIDAVVTLKVPQCLDPVRWLDCLVWTIYSKASVATESLQIWVKRSDDQIVCYYAVGEGGTMWVGKSDASECFKASEETVRMLAHQSKEYCCKPKTFQLGMRQKGNE